MKVELIRIPLKIRVLFRNEGYSFFLTYRMSYSFCREPIQFYHFIYFACLIFSWNSDSSASRYDSLLPASAIRVYAEP